MAFLNLGMEQGSDKGGSGRPWADKEKPKGGLGVAMERPMGSAEGA
jgi:hypothetical protein